MSDSEEYSEEEVSEPEEAPASPTRKSAPAPVEAVKPTEAELALQKRRQAQIKAAGLDEDVTEMLEENLKERNQMEDEIRDLKKRNEQRRKEREQYDKQQARRREEEEVRRKTEEEERRKVKELADAKKREEREKKSEQVMKWKNSASTNAPNFVINPKKENGTNSSEVHNLENSANLTPQKTKEQLEAEKRHVLQKRIPQLNIEGFDSSKLTDKAKELYNLIYRLECDKYDLEQRFKRQQYDMMELAEKARQMSKGGKGKKVQVSEEVDERQEKFAGCPAKIEMYSKYERQKDKREYKVRQVIYAGPIHGFAPPRINAERKVVWAENGLPAYEELTNGTPVAAEEE